MGQLKKPLSAVLRCSEDDFQFEWKEYLICIEKAAVSKDLGTETVAAAEPSVQEVNRYSQARPKKKGDMLLKPKNLEVQSFSRCIEFLLSSLSNPGSTEIGRKEVRENGVGTGTKRGLREEMDGFVSFVDSGEDVFTLSKKIKSNNQSNHDKDVGGSGSGSGNRSGNMNINNGNNSKDYRRLNDPKTTPLPQTPTLDDSHFGLPSFKSIQQRDYSFYSLNPFPSPSSLAEYQQQLSRIAEAVIRSFLFSTSSK